MLAFLLQMSEQILSVTMRLLQIAEMLRFILPAQGEMLSLWYCYY